MSHSYKTRRAGKPLKVGLEKLYDYELLKKLLLV
jgi:hypothetical protein